MLADWNLHRAVAALYAPIQHQDEKSLQLEDKFSPSTERFTIGSWSSDYDVHRTLEMVSTLRQSKWGHANGRVTSTKTSEPSKGTAGIRKKPV